MTPEALFAAVEERQIASLHPSVARQRYGYGIVPLTPEEARRLLAGQRCHCGGPIEPGANLCSACREKRGAPAKCLDCEEEVHGPKALRCKPHAEQHRAAQQRAWERLNPRKRHDRLAPMPNPYTPAMEVHMRYRLELLDTALRVLLGEDAGMDFTAEYVLPLMEAVARCPKARTL